MYTAVELLGSSRQKKITKPNKPADIYSFGIILYELINKGNRLYPRNEAYVINSINKDIIQIIEQRFP